MIVYNFIVGLINTFLIKGIFISVLVVIAARKLLKDDRGSRRAVNIVRWIMISYAVLTIVYYLAEFYISYFSGVEYMQYAFKGTYWFALMLMIGSNTVLPLLLLIPQLARKVYFILLVAVLINIGWLMEFWALHYHSSGIPYTDMWSNLLRGTVLGLLALAAGHITKRASLQ